MANFIYDNCVLDIYFDKNYGKLYEKIENGQCGVYRYRSKLGAIDNMFIKREIPLLLENEGKYFDIITPYGYGGPIILECYGDKEALVKDYIKKFKSILYNLFSCKNCQF